MDATLEELQSPNTEGPMQQVLPDRQATEAMEAAGLPAGPLGLKRPLPGQPSDHSYALLDLDTLKKKTLPHVEGKQEASEAPESPEAAASEDMWPPESLQGGTAGTEGTAGRRSTGMLSPSRLWDVGMVAAPWQEVVFGPAVDDPPRH